MSFLDVTSLGVDNTGAADVSAVLTQLLTAHGGGHTLYFPTGSYRLDEPLVVTGAIKILGDGFSSVLIVKGERGIELRNIERVGAVVQDIRLSASGETTALTISNCWGVRIQNVEIEGASIGVLVTDSANVDIDGAVINDFITCAVRGIDTGGDLFIRNVHANTGVSSHDIFPIGLWFSNVSGAQVSDCDFIKGRVGVKVDDASSADETANDWLKFTSVSADTTEQDSWHIFKAKGLQMCNCWSGTFLNGTGIFIGDAVSEMSVVNHQWQNGKWGIGNNSSSVVFTGGIMGGNVHHKLSTTTAGSPVIVNVLGM